MNQHLKYRMDPTQHYYEYKLIWGKSIFKYESEKCSEKEYIERSIFHFIKNNPKVIKKELKNNK